MANPPTLDEIVKGLDEACPCRKASSCVDMDGYFLSCVCESTGSNYGCRWPGHPIAAEIPGMVARLRYALDESVKHQAHYAKLLNTHDGGQRRVFATSDAWLQRLDEVAARRAQEDSHD